MLVHANTCMPAAMVERCRSCCAVSYELGGSIYTYDMTCVLSKEGVSEMERDSGAG